MATPVWTYDCAYNGFEVDRKLDAVVIPLGDGHYRTAIKSEAWDHQDGTGGADTSHRGYSVFRWTLPLYKYGANYTAPLDFIQARIDAGFEAFYIYDPLVEPTVANWDGVNTAGRHLVKCFELPVRRGDFSSHARFLTFTFHEVQP